MTLWISLSLSSSITTEVVSLTVNTYRLIKDLFTSLGIVVTNLTIGILDDITLNLLAVSLEVKFLALDGLSTCDSCAIFTKIEPVACLVFNEGIGPHVTRVNIVEVKFTIFGCDKVTLNLLTIGFEVKVLFTNSLSTGNSDTIFT